MSEEKQERVGGYIHICVHCKTQCGGKYCGQCGTAQGRREQDEANDGLFKRILNKPYECKVCV